MRVLQDFFYKQQYRDFDRKAEIFPVCYLEATTDKKFKMGFEKEEARLELKILAKLMKNTTKIKDLKRLYVL